MATTPTVTQKSMPAVLDEAAVQQFKSSLRGVIVQPGDANYDSARTLYNAMIDKHPALIAQCRDVADVIAAVNFGREQKLGIAIRSGGHHGAGLSSVDGGLMILHDRNYPSIGCTYCTSPVMPGENSRAGRWKAFTKTECGLHKAS